MYIICSLALMVLSQIIVPPSEAKPYFTKTHRLNAMNDFDDIVDWTSNENIKIQKEESPNSQKISDYSKIRERSISLEKDMSSKDEKRMTGPEKSNILETSQKMEISEISTGEDQKKDKKRSDSQELKDVMNENEYSEEFGEGISNLYNRMKNKMKKNNSKIGLNMLNQEVPMQLEESDDGYKERLKYILPHNNKRSAPMCLFNERGYFQPTAALPVVQPVLVDEAPTYFQGSPNIDKAAVYEVQWLQHSPASADIFRKRREIDNLYPRRTYSFIVDRSSEHNNKVSEAQKHLSGMIRSVKEEFLKNNNLTFLPILFVPNSEHNQQQSYADIPNSPELGQLTFENGQFNTPGMENSLRSGEYQKKNQILNSAVPSHGKISNCPGFNIGHLTIIFLSNNTLSVVSPGLNSKDPMPTHPEPQKTFNTQYSQSQAPVIPPSTDANFIFKRSVIDNLKQYLENAFNFIDIRRVLSDDELHDRSTRDSLKQFEGELIPGILLYPQVYGSTLTKCSREVNLCNAGTPMDYYYFTTTPRGFSKSKRSLSMKKSRLTENDIAAESEQKEVEKKQVQLEKEMQKDISLEKEMVQAINEGSARDSLGASDQMKKDEEYLEKEHEEVIHNEKLLEAPDEKSEELKGEFSETTCLFTDPLITENIELISSATDSIDVSISAEDSVVIEAGSNPEEGKNPEAEELEEADEAVTEPPPECESCSSGEPEESDPCLDEEESGSAGHNTATDKIGVKQAELAKESKSKISKSIAEFENEMRGVITGSKKQISEEKGKGVFDITTKSSASTKTPKSHKVICCRTCQRKRRDLQVSTQSSPNWKEAQRDLTEVVKVTLQENISPVALGQEVEDVSDVLFTSKPDQDQMEVDGCNEKKEDRRTFEPTLQKLGEPVTIVITKSTEAISTTAEVPSVLSDYIQPPLRDENDETVTETLNRLLRDLRLVNEVQNILEGIKETGYEIREAVKRRTRKSSQNDDTFSIGRKLFSMEVHRKAPEANGPFRKFKKKTYRRRSGEGFKRYSRTVNDNKFCPSQDENLEQLTEDSFDNEQFNFMKSPSSKKERWKDYTGNWVEWIPNFEPFLEPNYQNYQF